MIILFLIFIIIPMILGIAASVGLIVIFANSIVAAQTKRLSQGQETNEEAVREKVLAQVVWSCVGLLIAFILFLAVRYYLT